MKKSFSTKIQFVKAILALSFIMPLRIVYGKNHWVRLPDSRAIGAWTRGLINAVILQVIVLLPQIHAQTAEAVIYLDSIRQVVRGFGAANILPWRPDMTDSEIKTAFGTEEGQLGFTILRLMIEPTTNNWSPNLSTAKRAHDLGVLIFASPWNAPSDMLETVNGQKRVRHEKYGDYAHHLEDFSNFMETNGVPMYAISVQNEPDYGDWTRWTSGEMLTFMRDYASTIKTRVMAPESFQFSHSFSDPILNDSAACANLGIVGGHIYGGGIAPYPLATSKGKEIWMTEHYTDSQNSGNLWPLALDVGTEIHNVMTAGMNAYIWWYIVRFYGPISDGTNNSGNKGDVTKRGYIMSQYSRFIRPGYFRIQCKSTPQSNVFASAYKDSLVSKVVVVAINTASQAKNQMFVLQNGHVETFTPYVTSETKNCSRENDISASNDTLNTTLDAKSVTTFVSSGGVSVSVENSSFGPASFKLFQNYPNPFNPTTQINYSVPQSSYIRLNVYNLLGQDVATLFEGIRQPGDYGAVLNGSKLASGVYFYRLSANSNGVSSPSTSSGRSFMDTKKLILLK